MSLFSLGVLFDVLLGLFVFTGALCVSIYVYREERIREGYDTISGEDDSLPLMPMNAAGKWPKGRGEEEHLIRANVILARDYNLEDGARRPPDKPNPTQKERADHFFGWGSDSAESSGDDSDYEIEVTTTSAIEMRLKTVGATSAWELIKASHLGSPGSVYCPVSCCRGRAAFTNRPELLQHMKTITYSRAEHQAWVNILIGKTGNAS
mmetsp:Transcript_40901/g.68495  ORF Transcript_40901/g.68495 Transcript_40901/m.68495 type:complete len:208 (-) Transcript_40901:67-690(-)|eukprot:CAMPEP_0198212120 /NCGR_PEP_ID=MMETSP1445-20131203/25533_1 /TAXON_ID=36898 /ORGANISM="Pyramimonas sp., Strain CCMP2087" /LENGTH=207 /DNA_ID=CAMNT_0043886503 /DNA_START=225 /DNA_END=848 /DNA_ORIENTATION=-